MTGIDWDAVRGRSEAAEVAADGTRAPTPEQRRATLRERAERVAAPPAADAAGAATELLVFQLAWENYAVETRFVREVYPLRDLTPIPCTPAFMLGLVNLRGELRPVVELKRLFAMPERGLSNATRAVILNHDGRELGIVADVIVGVRSIGTAEIQPPPATFTGIAASFLRGIGPDRLVVLDVPNILGSPRLVVDDQVET